jgi:asparagine N-glycosylation enzyme membrane subunit Stt3
MQKLISATKIVFLLVAISACVAFFMGKLSENNFMILASGAFSFYFTAKQVPQNGNSI